MRGNRLPPDTGPPLQKNERGVGTAPKASNADHYSKADGLQHLLRTWCVAPGVCRFQTSRPDLARKLSQRSGARLVAWSVSGGYLRIFQENIEPWRARDLVKRYLKAANGVFSSQISPQETQNRVRGVRQQPNRKYTAYDKVHS